MENLRLLNVEVKSSNSIVLEFSHKLILGIDVDNIKIYSANTSVPNSDVLNIKQKDNLVFITCQPLTPFIKYDVKALKTLSYPFIAVNNIAKLLEDGISNVYSIFGPIEKENVFKSILTESLKDNVYDLDNQSTVPSIIINTLSVYLDKALDDIKNVRNENYISFDVIDEIKVRGSGPFDKLNEGSAYDIIRLSNHPTGTNLTNTFSVNTKNYNLISLQETNFNEIIYPDFIDGKGLFNLNSFKIKLSNKPIIKVSSIIFTLTTSNPIFTYDLNKYGYQLKSSRYDYLSSTLLTLEDDEIKLNEEVLKDSNFDINQILKIDISYSYKDLGKIISSDIDVFDIRTSVREVIPPITNSFNLLNFPVLDTNNKIASKNGLTIVNLNSKQRNIHSSFMNEIEFRYDNLPSLPGQFSVDYSTGKVFVFGSDFTKQGTSDIPPNVTYNYKYSFQEGIDFEYDRDLYDLYIMPKGKALDKTIQISFSYDHVYVKNLDYKCSLHEESLNERIQNKLLSLNCVKSNNYPITNVFRIQNETSGEVYSLDRFSGDKIYFRYNTPPSIKNSIENASFHFSEEKLYVNSYKTNQSLLKICIFELSNKNIISASNNGIANFMNTSLKCDSDLFEKEIFYFKDWSVDQNIDRLSSGQYCVDYNNGYIYLCLDSIQDSYGNVNYYYSSIKPNSPNVLYANNIYFDSLDKNEIPVSSVEYNSININNINDCIEYKSTSNYIINNKNIGYYFNLDFINKVSYNINYIYGLYEYDDFINSTNPINFSTSSTFYEKSITTESYIKSYILNIEYNDDGYFVSMPKEIYYNSPNITYNISAKYVNGSEIDVLSYTIDNNYNIINLNTSSLGLVEIDLSFTINDNSKVFVDYSKGNIICDYNYLADEILISYEYGSNSIDFRESLSIPQGNQYYVSYRVGALRDALIRNFSNLINIEELSSLDTYFDRERYRDCIYAALSSFLDGPTVEALERIVKTIVHTSPEIIESIFSSWSLGQSLLTPCEIKSNYKNLMPSRHGDGVLIADENDYVSFKAFNNLNLEEGSLEFWVTPQWNGLDNCSTINVEINESNLPIDVSRIFLGSTEINPTSNKFLINKNDIIKGSPNLNKDGVYLYLDKDLNLDYDRWYLYISDGYSGQNSNGFNIKLSSNEFYDFSIIDGYDASNITTTNSLIKINTVENKFSELYSFISDSNKYFVDLQKDKSRLSLFKDKSGYLVFSVSDKNGKQYKINHNVSNWLANDQHHVGISWKINSNNGMDEMHLFVDGLEVPNVLNYSSNVKNYLGQKLRTIAKESFIGSNQKDVISSTDLQTTSGSNIVKSLINFSSYNMNIGDTIIINDSNYSSNGYLIQNIYGQELELNSNMPITLDNLSFTINKTSISLNSDYYIYNNNYVYKLSSYADGYVDTIINSNILYIVNPSLSVGDLIRLDNNNYEEYYTIISVSTSSIELDNAMPITLSNVYYNLYKDIKIELNSPRTSYPDYNLNKGEIVLLNNVNKNDLVFISSLGLNYEIIKNKYYNWSDSLNNIIKTKLPKPVSIDNVNIYKVILDSYLINNTNSTLLGNSFTSNNIITDNPINSQSGRQLDLIISGSNIDFSSDVIIEINGNVNYSTVSEYISFSEFGTKQSVNSYYEVYYIKVSGKCINTNKNFLTVKCIETNNIFEPEVSYYTPVLNYSYVLNSGITLQKSSDNKVIDINNKFSNKNVGDYLLISEPITVAGFYKIIGINSDLNELEIDSTNTSYTLPISDFTDGYYKILNSVKSSSGIQNGFFNFEPKDFPGQQYMLRKGFYEFEYPSYLKIDFDMGEDLFFGSDYLKNNQANSILSELVIYNICLSDVRSGEEISDNNSITKDYNSIKKIKPNNNITFLVYFDKYPFINESRYLISDKAKGIKYSNTSVNDSFKNSIYLNNKSINVENFGYLDSRKEGTIEFWVNPIYDTLNDYEDRYYFDATSNVIETVNSITNKTIQVLGNIDRVISVKIMGNNTNYFLGGRLENISSSTKVTNLISSNKNKIILDEEASQILSVNIVNDYSKINYFSDGTLSKDNKTIILGKSLPSNNVNVTINYIPITNKSTTKQIIVLGRALPSNNTQVEVNYIQKGNKGSRISIFKDKYSYLNFNIVSNNTINSVRAPIVWSSNTWHKVKASYRINSSNDDMSLYIDGYKYDSLNYSENIVYGDNPYIYGSSVIGDGYYTQNYSIEFKDTLSYFTIGGNYYGSGFGNCSIDNLRISNKYRDALIYLNESIDVGYDVVENALPVSSDLYTTYLLDNDLEFNSFEDFAELVSKTNSSFEIKMNIFDGFKILESNQKSKNILEILLNRLKPANSRLFIKYVS